MKKYCAGSFATTVTMFLVSCFVLLCTTFLSLCLAAEPCQQFLGAKWQNTSWGGLYSVIEPDCKMTVYVGADSIGTMDYVPAPVEEIQGIGDVCASDRHCLAKDSRLECYLFRCRVAEAADPVEPIEPAQPSGKCEYKVGHPDYCFQCGPCTEGQGGCNRNWQCKGSLVCDPYKHICVKP